MFYIKYYWLLYIYCTSAGIFSLFLFIHKQCNNDKELAFHYDPDNTMEKEFDFIVVGGGSAGSLVAGRLAENSKYKVLLIEAGSESSTVFDVPLVTPLLQQSYIDWSYHTVPQNSACFGLKNNVSKWVAGKVFGGTSRLNYMVYLRGHKLDYEEWINGEDWNFNDILYYFKKSENQQGKYKNDKNYHGIDGPMYVSDLRYRTIITNTILEAGKELGYNEIDLNDMTSSPGFMPSQVTCHEGARWSSDYVIKKSLFSKIKDNLKIVFNTVVEKVLLKNGFEAYGVQIRRNGRIGEIFAKKSVILSAGTVGTAKILLLSGIGPERHLLSHNIKPFVNLPVGENLLDHVTTPINIILTNETLPITSATTYKAPLEVYDYIKNGNGVLTFPGCEITGVFHLENKTIPDVQLIVIPFGIASDAGVALKVSLGISDEIWREYFVPMVGEQVISIIPVVLHPKSNGYIRLRSSDPMDPPLINPKYLSHPYDVQILIKGIKLVKELIKTKTLRKIGARIYDKSVPGCESYDFGTDQYWECFIKYLSFTTYHPVGTCKMGHDDSSVVDYNLRVHKTNRLHVIDASIMPTMPSGNINAAVMMIAEKGADLIKYLWHINQQKCHIMELFIPKMLTPIK